MTNDLGTAHSRPPLLGFLPQRLFVPRGPIAYLALAWPVVTIPSLLLSALVLGAAGQEAGPSFEGRGPALFGLLVLFAPAVETLIMGTVLVLLKQAVGVVPAVLLSAFGWGIAHSFSAPAWGLVIWWPFLIFSTAFLVWEARGFWRAYALVTALHALQNLVPAALVAFGQG
jgi:hypothetical protein